MTPDTAWDVVELVPLPAPAAAAPLREMRYGARAWTPDEDAELIRRFKADESYAAIGEAIGRAVGSVQWRVGVLGLRRASLLPWTELQDAEVVRRYGNDPTAEIARDLGRSCGSIYVRAAVLGLTGGNPPRWTEWEDLQLREGYGRGVPHRALCAIIGRTDAAARTRASNLGLRHAAAPPEWSREEAYYALCLAEGTKFTYPQIAGLLVAAGHPRRSTRALGLFLRKQGYHRGWGRAWTPEEDTALREAYATGGRLPDLMRRLGRKPGQARWRAGYLGLAGTHPRPDGFRQGPVWTPTQDAILRAEYGRVKTRELAARLGRGRMAVCQRANVLGISANFFRPWTEEERRAVRIAHPRPISLTDLADALGRDAALVSREAIRMGLPFADRPVKAPRTPRAGRQVLTLGTILAMEPA